jgi:bifunctional pyridoxal-dependent enzyme with beta-cystathionase and maltose regulon repressor activities
LARCRAREASGRPLAIRIHDLRGTYVSWLATRSLTDEEIGRIIGWKSGKVAEVRHRYIDEARVIVSLVDRFSGAA